MLRIGWIWFNMPDINVDKLWWAVAHGRLTHLHAVCNLLICIHHWGLWFLHVFLLLVSCMLIDYAPLNLLRTITLCLRFWFDDSHTQLNTNNLSKEHILLNPMTIWSPFFSLVSWAWKSKCSELIKQLWWLFFFIIFTFIQWLFVASYFQFLRTLGWFV